MEPLWAMRVVGWCVAASVALFAAAVRRRSGGRAAAMLLWGGMLASVLAIDEAARLHEAVLPAMFGLTEQLLCAIYGAAAIAWIVSFRREITPPASLWLVGSITCFAAAVGVEHVGVGRHEILENALKLAGVTCWAAFFIANAAGQIRAVRIVADLATLTRGEQTAATELDALAATMAELTAMAKDAATRRSAPAPAKAPRKLSDRDSAAVTR